MTARQIKRLLDRKHSATYYALRRDRVLAARAEYRARNRAAIVERAAAYYAENRRRIRAQQRKYRLRGKMTVG